LDMARAAGLLGRQAWQRYPRAMLVARATGDLARLLFPDVVKGLGYVAEDEPEALEAWAPSEAPEVPEPRRKPLQRRKRAPVAPPEVGARPVEDTPLPDEPPIAVTKSLNRLAPDDELAPPSALPIGHMPGDVPLPLDDAADELAGVGPESTPPRDDGPAPVLPDPEPEQPDDEGAAQAPPRIGVAPLKAVRAGLRRQLGTVATPEERHGLLSAVVGHPVDSSGDLTRAEGYRVLAFFDELDEGTAGWEYVDPTDLSLGMRVLDLRTPPPEPDHE
jgi:hypothetical protein